MILSLVCVIGISPFIVFRAMHKDWAMVVLDLVIVLGMGLVFIYVYRTRKIKVPSIFFLIIAQSASIVSFYINGGNLISWIYPAMLSIFFLRRPKVALSINILLLLLYLPKLFSSFVFADIAVIIISVFVTNIIAYTFSEGLRSQERVLKKLASEDYLTGTGNRRALTTSLDKLYTKLQESDEKASLLLLDLDYFKKINDEHGHLVGDKVLVDLSELMKNFFIDNEIFRYGGEEFLVSYPNKNIKEIFVIAEEFREIVKNNNLIEGSQITISIGVAEYQQGESQIDWIHRVDTALYRAKNEGRDRTIKA